ncbi:MAG TPA: multicopper oxidase domain-containing protein [Longimicrobiales bacterium]
MRWYLIVVACTAVAAASAGPYAGQTGQNSEIAANDNRAPSGVLRDSVLTIEMVAGAGTWYPSGRAGAGRAVYAFGTAAGLTNPGPLIRVPTGTVVRATVRNELDRVLTVHGFFDRPGGAATITVQPGDSARVQFRLNEPGTFHYWGSTRGAARLTDRFGAESQLVGAIVVDEPGAPTDDHVFVIGIEDDSAAVPARRRVRAAVVNGRSWPYSHSSTVRLGETVRMRWLNVSDRFHPMHLHGFYFRVNARGDIAGDTLYEPAGQRMVVTELLAPGQTMSMSWVPERAGNWLMHCHMAEHISPELRGGHIDLADADVNHALDAMAGIVTGWRVSGDGARAAAKSSPLRPRGIRLIAQAQPGRYGLLPALGFVIQEGDVPAADSVAVPGPPLVLVRDQPVRIMVVNRLSEATSVHWHGIELESYYDGVSGWSGEDDRIAPHIAPGDSFEVRFTPPRAGTFIYHTHFDEERQLSSGMYGPIIVLEPGRRYEPETDRVWVLSQNGPSDEVRVALNGAAEPVLDMQENRRYRIRLINISPNVPLTLTVLADSTPVVWRMVAKDGADLPAAQLRTQSAVQRIGVGETYDFELTPVRSGELVLRATNPFGAPLLTGRIRVRAEEGRTP